jgi:hypothetical protein
MVAHAGYAKRRCRLVQAGVELYELKLASGVAAGDKTTFGSVDGRVCTPRRSQWTARASSLDP